MKGGCLLLSRETLLYPHFKKRFAELGFANFDISGEERDSLNAVIGELKPRLMLVGSGYFECATPYMVGLLAKKFPEINIAAVSVFYKIPADLAMWFIVNGAKSYVSVFDGTEEFYRGLAMIRDGKKYVSPKVAERIELRKEMPEPAGNITGRHLEIIRLLCNGFRGVEICNVLNISEQTLYVHKRNLYTNLNVRNENELIRVALRQKWITVDELRFFGGDYHLNPLPEKKEIPAIRRVK